MVTSNVWSSERLEESGKNGNVKDKSVSNFCLEGRIKGKHLGIRYKRWRSRRKHKSKETKKGKLGKKTSYFGLEGNGRGSGDRG